MDAACKREREECTTKNKNKKKRRERETRMPVVVCSLHERMMRKNGLLDQPIHG